MRLAILLPVLVIAAVLPVTIAATTSDAGGAFIKANEDFAAGRFADAAHKYESLVRSGHVSTSVFYDLGNAWFRSGDLGRAILNYERALTLDVHHPEAAANLRVVRDQARALELLRGTSERYFAMFTLSQYCWIAAATFWIAAFLIAAARFSPRRSTGRVLATGCAAVVFGASICALYTLENGGKGQALAIVTAPKTEARLATADNANSVLALPPGSEIKILSTRGDWIYAGLPNQLRGWIPAKSAERVRL